MSLIADCYSLFVIVDDFCVERRCSFLASHCPAFWTWDCWSGTYKTCDAVRVDLSTIFWMYLLVLFSLLVFHQLTCHSHWSQLADFSSIVRSTWSVVFGWWTRIGHPHCKHDKGQSMNSMWLADSFEFPGSAMPAIYVVLFARIWFTKFTKICNALMPEKIHTAFSHWITTPAIDGQQRYSARFRHVDCKCIAMLQWSKGIWL